MLTVSPVAEDNFGDLPPECRCCLYWECPEQTASPEASSDREARKREWFRQVEGNGGMGLIAYQDGRPVGYAQFGPEALLPNARSYTVSPPHQDAAFLACLVVFAGAQGIGLGSFLLEQVLVVVRLCSPRQARRLGFRAVETFARKGSANNPSGPVGFYLKRGFSIVSDDPEFPLLRRHLEPD